MGPSSPAAPVVAALRPQRYGRYILLEKIGQGGMAEVFRAVAHGTQGFQRIIVVKRILPQLSRDPAFVQMFIDEAKISALISHPNVVQVFEFGKIADPQLGDTYFLAMEYLHGRNLSAVMQTLVENGRMPPVDVMAEIVRQAALGLDHAHNMTSATGAPLGLVHRDVTPANLMLGFNGAVKVLDFGIARAVAGVKEPHTDAGAVKGKVAYLAPEQIQQQPMDRRSDVFALGVVLFECLTGRRLFKADNQLATMKLILEADIPSPSTFNPGVSIALDRIVARALQRDPRARYQTAKQMAVDLESFLHEARYTSERLPAFLGDLWKGEVTGARDRLLPAEAAAVLALAEVRPAADDLLAGVRTPVLPVAGPVTTGSIVLSIPQPLVALWPRISQPRWKLIPLGALPLGLIAFLATRPSPPRPAPAVVARAPALPAARAATVHVSVDSTPQGASVWLSPGRVPMGATPVSVTLPRQDSAVELVLEKEGFEPETLTVIADIDKALNVQLRTSLPEQAPSVQNAPRPAPPRARKKPQGTRPLDPFE